ncbi:hypothetical protein EV189_3485 [Motilibacter rhizosphaerae]|uniref:Uncharacterized protein n=2 Tax=Motilibacter rhizosphaerae TaxID=598652 RepID=A0A4Q7NAT1_9ACTN|nr:hypothetical protein EV189_3485 [Motilibacter rhizosphaerae]
MTELGAWCGFLGACMLVVGPVYQAVLELDEEGLEHEDLAAVDGDALVPRVPLRWWLLPPVAWWKVRRRQEQLRRALVASLAPDKRLQLLGFTDKATGWVFVSAGGLLIAAKETVELLHELEWAGWLLWPVLVVLAATALGHALLRTRRSAQLRDRLLELP